MDAKTVSLVQVNFQQGPKELNAHYLPYSVGVLWAYANSFETVRKNFRLQHLIWKRDDIESVLAKICESDVVAFSTYVWNRNYSYTLAESLRKKNRDCLIVFGGPELPITDPEIFDKYPFMDIVVKQEGEVSFKKVLEWFVEKDTNEPAVRGLLINSKDGLVDTGNPERIEDLNSLPSPYLTGVFDSIIRDNPAVEWNATLETNRGCPYKCTFCDWGSLTYTKLKLFNLDRIYSEIDWIAHNKCGYISIADANFGIFPDRDEGILDRILEIQNKFGHPSHFTINWAKNQKRRVVDMVSKIIFNSKMSNQGLTLSVQSLNEKVLSNIKRKNMEIDKIEEIFELCDRHRIPVNTELILGLPGETLESWKNNFWRLFGAGQHTGIAIYQAQLLENAEMNLSQKELFGIRIATVYDYMSGSNNDDRLKEGVTIVTATKDMPYHSMLDAQVFNWFINTFHINGLTNYISRFLHKRSIASYREFYEGLFRYVGDNPWFKNEMAEVRRYYDEWMTAGVNNHPKLGEIEIHGWNLINRSVIQIHAEKKYHEMFCLIRSFVVQFGLGADIEEDLIALQMNYVINYDDIHSYPKYVTLSSNIYDYIIGEAELECGASVEYQFDFPENKDMSFRAFLENLYFGRRKNFGKAVIKGAGESITPLPLVDCE